MSQIQVEFSCACTESIDKNITVVCVVMMTSVQARSYILLMLGRYWYNLFAVVRDKIPIGMNECVWG